MTPPKNPKVQIGQPLDELPEPAPRTTPPAAHWLKVAKAARDADGKWLPVRVGHLTVDRHRQVGHDIRHRKIVAFRDGNYDARFIDGTLYVRHLAENEEDSTPDDKPLPDGPLKVIGLTRGGVA